MDICGGEGGGPGWYAEGPGAGDGTKPDCGGRPKVGTASMIIPEGGGAGTPGGAGAQLGIGAGGGTGTGGDDDAGCTGPDQGGTAADGAAGAVGANPGDMISCSPGISVRPGSRPLGGGAAAGAMSP